MVNVNTFVYLAIFLVIANFATGGFVFQQMGKVDMSPYAGSAQCFVGAYMYSPSWNGIPMPAADDMVVAVIMGLLILGILSALNKKVSLKKKIVIFVGSWLLYKYIGYYLMVIVPGCSDKYAVVDEALSPLGPIFLILAIFVLWKFLRTRKK